MFHVKPEPRPVLDLQGVVKKFGNFRALDGLNLSVREGSVHGFLGPNGSGKSTAIRTLLGLLHPTAGSVRVLGEDPARTPQILTRIGYVPGDVALWPTLTGAEVLRALESLRGRPSDRVREAELIEAFALDVRKRTREYSTGNRLKVSLVAALSIDAEVLILDEPTAGLDPLMEQVFIEQIRAANRRGTTVLLSSHIMAEVEKLCDHVTVIKDGRVVEDGPLAELRHLSAHRVTARLPDAAGFAARHPAALHEGETVMLTAERAELSRVLREVLDAGGEDVLSRPASLEEIFLEHYQAEVAPEVRHAR